MEKLSRMKKYEELRRTIETDNHVDTAKESTSNNGDTLKQFNSAVLKKAKIIEEHQPEREKTTDKATFSHEKEDVTFTNEYMDDFIQEVREYNIKKGNKECISTQADILNQLNAIDKTKKARYVEPITVEKSVKEKKSFLSKDAIALEVAHLLQDDDLDELVIDEETKAADPNKKNTEEKVILKSTDNTNSIPFQEKSNPNVQKKQEVTKKTIDETKKLREQINEYEDELTDLSDGVEKTNKMLNFVICCLVLVLLVIIGFIVYSLLKAGGKV